VSDALDILVDLKPAMDGYAGIPQETRLLFAGFQKLPGARVQGLIQHGSRRLSGGLSPAMATGPAPQRIFPLSQFVVSLSDTPPPNTRLTWKQKVQRYIALNMLQWNTERGRETATTEFQSQLFPDFIWRTFFDKTLNPSEMPSVVGGKFRIAEPSRHHFHRVGLKNAGSARGPTYPLLNTRGFDYLLAQNPYPARVSASTQMVVRYHDAVPILMPHTIGEKAFHQASHFHALRSNVASGAVFSCISEATRRDLLKIFPELESRSFVIHNMVSEEYFQEDTSRNMVSRIVANRAADLAHAGIKPAAGNDPDESIEYLLMVSTIEPRKNHLALVRAWEKLKYGHHPRLRLIVVGSMGWDHQAVLRAFKPWIEQGELSYLQSVPSAELRALYRHAAATVCPSLAEGFDYSGIEAMRCGCPVIASDIEVHREVYANAALYFNPYSPDDAAASIAEVLSSGSGGLRDNLVGRGIEVSQRYMPAPILSQWERWFKAHSRQTAGRTVSAIEAAA
jgi:glycosyltransferase involved in cell wall biosynthesis